MNKIIFPLKRQVCSPKVTDLQNTLLILQERKRTLFAPPTLMTHVLQPPNWNKIKAELEKEREKAYYGKTTRWLVTNLLHNLHLPATGEVDKRTAEAINDILKELGFLETEGGGKCLLSKEESIWKMSHR